MKASWVVKKGVDTLHVQLKDGREIDYMFDWLHGEVKVVEGDVIRESKAIPDLTDDDVFQEALEVLESPWTELLEIRVFDPVDALNNFFLDAQLLVSSRGDIIEIRLLRMMGGPTEWWYLSGGTLIIETQASPFEEPRKDVVTGSRLVLEAFEMLEDLFEETLICKR